MKKLIRTTLVFFTLWAAVEVSPLSSAPAQTSMGHNVVGALTNRPGFPLTNGLGFTNTLVHATNLSTLQLSNVLELLLSLQTNVEQALPILTTLTSNANFEASSGTPQVPTTVIPFTSIPGVPLVSPTDQSANTSVQPTNISTILGSNILEFDPATFEGLVSLQTDLEHALPVLQMLNGTAPSETNALTPTGVENPFALGTNTPVVPLTNGFFLPLTNQSRVLTIPSPF